MFYVKFIVRKHERALLFRDGDFVKFLEPGVHRIVDLMHKFTIERFDVTVPVFGHRLQDFLIEKYPRQLERYFDIVETGQNEIAVVYHNDRVTMVMAPAISSTGALLERSHTGFAKPCSSGPNATAFPNC